jgi:predicted O-methyltransferase YrrM
MKIFSDIYKVDLSELKQYIDWCPAYAKYFMADVGREHYKLLSHLTSQLPDGSTVVDLGTLNGSSALALASNPNIKVVTYDIVNNLPDPNITKSILHMKNTEFRLKDGIQDMKAYIDMAPLIFLDVDPHDGVQEKRFFELLIENNYKGVVVCDDIHLNADMDALWNWIPKPKIDVTKYGHWSGTGIVLFDTTVEILLV